MNAGLNRTISLSHSIGSPTTKAENTSFSFIETTDGSKQLKATLYSKFSELRIKEINVGYLKMENSSWYAMLKFKALELDDERPNSTLAVKQMFQPLKRDVPLIQLLYYVDSSSNAQLALLLDNLRVNLCLPYILKLYQMAMDAISINDPNKKAADASTSQSDHRIKNIQNNTKNIKTDFSTFSEARKSTNVAAPVTLQDEQDIQAKKETSLIVKGKIKLPQVILFAQPEKKDSKVLVMSTALKLDFNSKAGDTELEVKLTRLAMNLAEYNNLGRKGIQFLMPCSIGIKMTQLNGQKIPYYTANLDALCLNMTPILYEVVMGVVSTINMSGTEKQAQETIKQKLLEVSEPFIARPDKKENYEMKNTDIKTQVDVEEQLLMSGEVENKVVVPKEENKSPTETTKILEALDLKIKEFLITFCEESGVELQPLAIVKLQLDGRVANWTKNLHVKADLTLEAIYYNDNLSTWEPLIETVMQKEDEYRPWILNIWFAMEPGSVLQPPKSNEKLEVVEFPPKNLDDTDLEAQLRVEEFSDAVDSFDQNENLIVAVVPQAAIDNIQSKKVFHNADDVSANAININDAPIEQTTQTANYILVESKDVLNLNVTPSAYKVIMYLAQITAGSKQEEIMENKNKAALKMNNFMGMKCDLWVSKELNLKTANALNFTLHRSKKDLSPLVLQGQIEYNQRAEIDQEITHEHVNLTDLQTTGSFDQYKQQSHIESLYDDRYKIDIQIEGYEKVKLSIKKDGQFLISLKELKPNVIQNKNSIQIDSIENSNDEDADLKINRIENMMYKVRTLYGRQKIIFSSPLQIENETKLVLYVYIKITDKMLSNKAKWDLEDKLLVKIDNDGDTNVAAAEVSADAAIIVTAVADVALGHENSISRLSPERNNSTNTTYAQVFTLLPGKIYYVPLMYAYFCELYTSPDITRYEPSSIFNFRENNFNIGKEPKQINCKRFNVKSSISKTNLDDHHVDFVLSRELVTNVKNSKIVMPALFKLNCNYRCILHVPITILNSLPFVIRLNIDEKPYNSSDIKPGESLNLHLPREHASNCKIHVYQYLRCNWIGQLNLSDLEAFKRDDRKPIRMDKAPDSSVVEVDNKHLNIYVHYKLPNQFSLYSPYWIVNKTGKMLKIKVTCIDITEFLKLKEKIKKIFF